jgi:CheY-like chemotaxis protein
MRSQQAKLRDWLFNDDTAAGPGSPDAAEEPFDSFGPIADLRRVLQQNQPLTQDPHDCPRILVAESDPYHRRVLRVLLANPRISSIEVEDGQSAVDLLSLRSFDVILLGMNLPIMTGSDVVRWVRRSQTPWSDIPILGMIDDAHRDQTGRLLSWGMTDWTPKPIARNDLAGKLISLMPGLADAGL